MLSDLAWTSLRSPSSIPFNLDKTSDSRGKLFTRVIKKPRMAVEGSVCARQEIESSLAKGGPRDRSRNNRRRGKFSMENPQKRLEYSCPSNCSPSCSTLQFAARATTNESAVCLRVYFLSTCKSGSHFSSTPLDYNLVQDIVSDWNDSNRILPLFVVCWQTKRKNRWFIIRRSDTSKLILWLALFWNKRGKRVNEEFDISYTIIIWNMII